MRVRLDLVRRALGELPEVQATKRSEVREATRTSVGDAFHTQDNPPIRFPKGGEILQNVTAAEIEGIVRDIAPLVARDTGSPVSADRIKVEVLSEAKFTKRVVDEVVRRVGYTKEELSFRDPDWLDRLRSSIAKAGMKHALTAAWLVADDTMVFSRRRIEGMSRDRLRETTYHELVHSGQDFNGEAFFAAASAASKRAAELMLKNGNDTGDDYFDARDQANALMTLAEGQATFLQGKAVDRYFPKASGAFDLWGAVGGLMTLASKGGLSKLMQYVAGNAVVSKLYESNPALLDVLFDHPILAEVLFRTRGVVDLKLAVPRASPEFDEVVKLVTQLMLTGPAREEGFEIQPRAIDDPAATAVTKV